MAYMDGGRLSLWSTVAAICLAVACTSLLVPEAAAVVAEGVDIENASPPRPAGAAPGPGAPKPAQPKSPSGLAPGLCRISLSNGDQLQARPESIADGKLLVHPQVAPDSVITLDLGQIQQVSFDREEQRPAGAMEILRLRDGSLLVGKFVRLGDKALQFDLEGTGPIEVPLEFVEELSRADAAPPKTSVRAQAHVVSTDAGDVLVGRLQQESGGLLAVQSDALLARVNYGHVRCVLFPVPESVEAGEAKTKRVFATIGTCGGMNVVGLEPRLEAGKFSVTIAGGRRIEMPLDQIAHMAFSTEEAGSRPRRILAWGAYGDRSEEFPRTLAAIRDNLAPTWAIVENFSVKFDDEFRRELQRSGVLLIPELDERWNAEAEALAPELKKVAESFLRRGGTIVVLSMMQRQIGWLAQAELLDVALVGGSDGDVVTFTDAGRWIAEGVGPSFRTCNSTQFYRIGPNFKAEPLAGTADRSPIIMRQVGRGRIILIGMDYYESNDQTKRILVNAATRP